MKLTNIRIIGVPEGEEGGKGAESLLKIKQLRTSQTWREMWTYKFMNLVGHPIISMQNELLQDIF